MNFDFSDDLKALREQARKFLAARASRSMVRKAFEAETGCDAALWAEIARMGWLWHGGARSLWRRRFGL
jgi:acyl-CoA dehydrogenase